MIGAATRTGADLLGVSQELGTVEKGKVADLLITEEDPLQDLGCLRRPWAVLKGGVKVAGYGKQNFGAGRRLEVPNIA